MFSNMTYVCLGFRFWLFLWVFYLILELFRSDSVVFLFCLLFY